VSVTGDPAPTVITKEGVIMSDPYGAYKAGFYDQSVTDRDGNVLGKAKKHDHLESDQDHEEQPAKPKMIMGKPRDDR